MWQNPAPRRASPRRPLLTSSSNLVGTTLLERYRVDRLLGEGGMGAVYVGEHLLLSKRVAIKVLHPEMLENAEVVARFQREALASAHIDHPHVAVATDFGKLEDGSSFLVLEYLEGRSVRELLDQAGALDPLRALKIARQIASALVRAHGLGIVHRDLKPDNVMLIERDGDPDFVKILDFGIAKVPVKDLVGAKVATPAAKGLTQLGIMYGTPEYMAPEQILGEDIDARADLYALGVMLHEMVAGERPFVSDNRMGIVTMHLTSPPPRLGTKVPSIDGAIEELVLGLLVKDPTERIPSARDVADRIDAILGGPGSRVLSAQASTVLGGLSPTPPSASPIDEAKARLEAFRSGLPDPLRTAPLAAFAIAPAAALLGLLLVLVLFFALRGGGDAPSSPGAPTPSASAPAPLTDDDVLLAKKRGSAAVEELMAKYPGDGRLVRALVVTLADEKKKIDAMKRLREALPSDKAIADDPSIQRTVKSCAEDPDADDLAFELMQGPLGAVGPELLWDLQQSQKVGQRATKALQRPEVKELSPAVAIAMDLRAAVSCDAKKALLGRAKEHGDKRVLQGLKALRGQTGCGFLRRSDCYPCLRMGPELGDAIREIEARAAATPVGE